MGYGNGYFGSPWGFMGGYGGTPTGSETSKPGIGNNRGIMTPPIQRLPESPGQPGQPGTGTGTGGGYASPPIGTAPGPGTGTQAPGGPVMVGGQPPTIGQAPGGWARSPDMAGTNCRGLRGITTTAADLAVRLSHGPQWSQEGVTGQRGGGDDRADLRVLKVGNLAAGTHRISRILGPTGASPPIQALLSYLGGYQHPGAGPFL